MKHVTAMMPSTDPQRLHLRDAQHQRQNIHHGLVHPAENDAIDGNAQVQRAESSQERRGLAGVADFGELDVGHDAGAPPQARVEEHRQHAAGDEAPPQPVAGDASHGDHAGDRQRRVRGERGRDHGGPGQPPGNVAAGEKKLVHAGARAGPVVQSDAEVEQEVQRDDGPVERCELHLGRIILWRCKIMIALLFSTPPAALLTNPADRKRFAPSD